MAFGKRFCIPTTKKKKKIIFTQNEIKKNQTNHTVVLEENAQYTARLVQILMGEQHADSLGTIKL